MMYYFTYYAGNTNLFTIYNLIAIGCGIAGPFTAPILMEKCGNKGRIVALGAIGSGALFVAMNFTTPVPIPCCSTSSPVSAATSTV